MQRNAQTTQKCHGGISIVSRGGGRTQVASVDPKRPGTNEYFPLCHTAKPSQRLSLCHTVTVWHLIANKLPHKNSRFLSFDGGTSYPHRIYNSIQALLTVNVFTFDCLLVACMLSRRRRCYFIKRFSLLAIFSYSYLHSEKHYIHDLKSFFQ